MLFLGIDPGAITGAYAVIDSDSVMLDCADLPMTSSKKLKWLDGPELASRIIELRQGRPMTAAVERQGARPGQGVSSTFVSACAFGSVLACLQMIGCPIDLVQPFTWKAATGLLHAKKGDSLDKARLLFPNAQLARKKDHNRGEALMIARYALERWRKPIPGLDSASSLEAKVSTRIISRG